MSLRKTLLAATVLALPVAAQAQVNAPVTGLYIAGGGGLNYHQDSRDSGIRIEYDNIGGVGVGSVGYGFGNGLRVEIEGNYRENRVDRVRVGGVRAATSNVVNAAGVVTSTVPVGPSISDGGQLKNYGVMVNVIYDFALPLLGFPVVPYLGVGAGYGWVESQKIRGDFASGPAGQTTRFFSSDTDSNFAYQGIAGFSLGLDNYVPGLALTTEYRFYGTIEPQLEATTFRRTNLGATVPGTTARGTFEPTNYNHSVLLGLRYAFNAPQPPAAVVTPPPPVGVARTYLVFFDWDRADLTDRARQIIVEAAGAARRVASTRIEVAGHADRSGTPQYNQRLSQRRAEVVAAELVRNGVNRGEIVVTAFGESRPLVPTADGVREPQNRRVEIVLR